MKSSKSPTKKFLVAAGYMGECCDCIHTLVKVISARTPEEAQTKLADYLTGKGFDCDATPVVVPPSYLKRLA
jgi:hypothetical protein